MKRLGLLTVLIAALAGLGLMIGCSGKSDPAGSNLIVGDTTDVAFQVAQQLVGSEGDMLSFDDAELSIALFETATGYGQSSAVSGSRVARAASASDSISNIIISDWTFTQDFWFVCSFSATQHKFECEGDVCDTVITTLEGIDSLQLVRQGDPLDTSQIVDGFDEVRARAHVGIGGASAIGDFSANAHRWVNLESHPTNDSLVIVNAGAHDTLAISFQGDSASCDIVVTENGSIRDLMVLSVEGVEGECPRSGSASKTATLSLACLGTGSENLEALDIDGAWSVDANVQMDGSVQVSYSDGTTQWTTYIESGGCL